jgi:orotate phosphoribosyltransferase
MNKVKRTFINIDFVLSAHTLEAMSANTIAANLLQINAIKIRPHNPFTWASGWLSPIYCDNRLALSYPQVRDEVKRGFVEAVKQLSEVDIIVGVATAGVPHGAILADALSLPFAYVRSKAKAHGRQNQIEGVIRSGQKAVMVEDLISTGGSLIKAAEAVQDAGAEIVSAMAIFTYGFPHAEANLQEAGLPWQTLTDYGILLNEAVKLSYISQDDLATLNAWREAPDQWGK